MTEAFSTLWRHFFRYRLRVMFHMLCLTGVLLSGKSCAASDWDVDGEHGYLSLSGLLSEGACSLDMSSAHQDVNLGLIGRNKLRQPGDRGMPMFFTIRLRGCARTGGDETDIYSAVEVTDAVRPVVTLRFTGVADSERPVLFSTTGVTGIGLMLTDSEGRVVHPGMPGEPQILQTGDNVLAYTVTPVRTSAPLSEGGFRAVISFEVSYD